MRSQFLRGLVGLVLIMLAGALGIVGSQSTSAGPTDEPRVTVEKKSSGQLRAYVDVDLSDKGARDRYAARVRAEAASVVRSGGGTVPVLVTFSAPVSASELATLSKDTGLTIDSVNLEGRDQNNNLITVAWARRAGQILDFAALARGYEAGALRIVGVTVVHSSVPATEAGLGRLTANPRVFTADVSAGRLKRELAARHGVSPDDIDVIIPSPHWALSSER